MNMSTNISWSRLAGSALALGILAYFVAAFEPLPDAATRLFAFAFGPLLCVSFLAIHRYMSRHHDGPVLQLACLFGIIAGVLVTTMLVLQIGNNMVRTDLLASAETEAARDSITLTWSAVNRVQFLLDVVWDIFILAALILLGAAMLSHPRFGKIWGGLGILVSAAALVLNLQTFPFPPAEAGSVDLGPLVALWMLAASIRFLFISDP